MQSIQIAASDSTQSSGTDSFQNSQSSSPAASNRTPTSGPSSDTQLTSDSAVNTVQLASNSDITTTASTGSFTLPVTVTGQVPPSSGQGSPTSQPMPQPSMGGSAPTVPQSGTLDIIVTQTEVTVTLPTGVVTSTQTIVIGSGFTITTAVPTGGIAFLDPGSDEAKSSAAALQPELVQVISLVEAWSAQPSNTALKSQAISAIDHTSNDFMLFFDRINGGGGGGGGSDGSQTNQCSGSNLFTAIFNAVKCAIQTLIDIRSDIINGGLDALTSLLKTLQTLADSDPPNPPNQPTSNPSGDPNSQSNPTSSPTNSESTSSSPCSAVTATSCSAICTALASGPSSTQTCTTTCYATVTACSATGTTEASTTSAPACARGWTQYPMGDLVPSPTSFYTPTGITASPTGTITASGNPGLGSVTASVAGDSPRVVDSITSSEASTGSVIASVVGASPRVVDSMTTIETSTSTPMQPSSTVETPTSTLSAPSPSDSCHTHYDALWDEFDIYGRDWDLDKLNDGGSPGSGSGLLKQLRVCSVVSDWKFENLTLSATQPWDFHASGHTSIWQQKCIGGAMQKAGAPADICDGSS